MKFANIKKIEDIEIYLPKAIETLRQDIIWRFEKNPNLHENFKWRNMMGEYIWKYIESEIKKEHKIGMVLLSSIGEELKQIQMKITSEIQANY
jgi:hypothetical protein